MGLRASGLTGIEATRDRTQYRSRSIINHILHDAFIAPCLLLTYLYPISCPFNGTIFNLEATLTNPTSSLTKSSSSLPPVHPLGPLMDPSNHSQPLSSVPSHSSTLLRQVRLTLLPLKKSTSEMSFRLVLVSHQHVKLHSLQVSKAVRMRLQSTKYVPVA